MDPRRLLTACAVLSLLAATPGCASLNDADEPSPSAETAVEPAPAPPPRVVAMAPIPNPPEREQRSTAATEPTAPGVVEAVAAERPLAQPAPAAVAPRASRRRVVRDRNSAPASGRAAIAAANAQARIASAADGFEGGVQVFGWEPGRLYEVWTAPLRVTTLTLAPGETVTAKAAGDTVRWQIGETTSGSGPGQRTHVLVKPLEAGLETNLLLTTSERVYMLLLRSGAAEGFNAAVAWRYSSATQLPAPASHPAGLLSTSRLDPERLDGAYRVEPRTGLGGRWPRWTPASVFNDGARTFIALPPEAAVDEAPVLFVLAPDGEAQVVNYRQQGSMLVVDRVFDRAELRLGDKRPQVVRISRVRPRSAP